MVIDYKIDKLHGKSKLMLVENPKTGSDSRNGNFGRRYGEIWLLSDEPRMSMVLACNTAQIHGEWREFGLRVWGAVLALPKRLVRFAN